MAVGSPGAGGRKALPYVFHFLQECCRLYVIRDPVSTKRTGLAADKGRRFTAENAEKRQNNNHESPVGWVERSETHGGRWVSRLFNPPYVYYYALRPRASPGFQAQGYGGASKERRELTVDKRRPARGGALRKDAGLMRRNTQTGYAFFFSNIPTFQYSIIPLLHHSLLPSAPIAW